MALPRQKIAIPIVAGVDTKTDSKQLQIGKFELLENVRLTSPLKAQKRFGFDVLPIETVDGGTLTESLSICSYNRELLVLTGEQAYTWIDQQQEWLEIASHVSLDTQTTPLVETAYNQQHPFYIEHSNGYAGYIYGVQDQGSFYAVKDLETGATIIDPTLIAGSFYTEGRVGVVGDYIVFFWWGLGDADGVSYIAIDTTDIGAAPVTATITFAENIDIQWVNSNTNNDRLYLSVTDSADDFYILYLDDTLTPSSIVNVTGAADGRGSFYFDTSDQVWWFYQDSGSIYYLILDEDLVSVLAATDTTLVSVDLPVGGFNAVDGYGYVFVRESTPTAPATRYIQAAALDTSGTLIATTEIGGGLRARGAPFYHDGYLYLPCQHTSDLQNTMFLIRQDDYIAAKSLYGTLAITDDTEYTQCVRGLDGSFYAPFTSTDSIVASQGEVVKQKGTSLLRWTFDSRSATNCLQFSDNLHITGSYLRMYDGQELVEHGFHLFPEGLTSAFSFVLDCDTVMSNANMTVVDFPDPNYKIKQGMFVSGSGLSGAYIDTINPTTGVLLLSHAPSATANDVPMTFSGGGIEGGGSYQYFAIYEWTDAKGNRHKSAPSPALTVEVPVGSTVTVSGTATSGSAVFAAGSDPDRIALLPGQLITSASYPAGTRVVSRSGTNVTLSEAATSTGADTIETDQTAGVFLTVPTLKQTAKLNITTPVAITIYRTELDSTTPYRITSITAPVINDPSVDYIEYMDTTNDFEIVGNEILYTTGGVIENIPLPANSYVTSYKSRVIAIPSNNDSSFWYSKEVLPGQPVEFSDLFVWNVDQKGGDLTAAIEMDDKLILTKEGLIFYMVGNGPSATGAGNTFSSPVIIAGNIGCTEPASVVLTDIGVLFKSKRGVYLLGRGLQLEYIGAPVEQYNDLTITRALNLPEQNEVRFFTLEGPTLVYDTFLRVWYTAAGQTASGAALWNDAPAYCNLLGEVFTETAAFTDAGNAVNQRFTTGWLSFADVQGFQRVYNLLILGEYKSAHTLNVNIYTDWVESAPAQTVTITPRSTEPYQYEVYLSRQKTTAIRIDIQEVVEAPNGEGMSLSNLALEVGIKQGLNKIPSTRSA